MTRDNLIKVRDVLATHFDLCDADRGYLNHEANKAAEALAILDAAIAAPEQEPDYFGLTNDGTWLSVTKDYYKKLKPDMRMAAYREPPAPEPQPIARVAGYYGGNCVIEPLDGKTVFSSGMAVYSAPVAAQEVQPTDCTRIMREQGKPYPRTCPRCKLGPCAYSPAIAFTAPPSSEWVSLTEAESDKAIDASGWPKNLLNDFVWGKLREVVKAADAALRKKNSGEQA